MRNEKYLDLLFTLIQERSDRKFEIAVDDMMGTFCLSWLGENFNAYATPFFEGTRGILVTAYDEDGNDMSDECTLPFAKTGDLEQDAAEYVRLANLLPAIFKGAFGSPARAQKKPTEEKTYCYRCSGIGCEHCNGTGEERSTVDCPTCEGTGGNQSEQCSDCDGDGSIFADELPEAK